MTITAYRSMLLIIMGTAAAVLCSGQNLLLPSESRDLGLRWNPTERRIWAFSMAGEEAVILLRGPGLGSASGELIAIAPDGTRRNLVPGTVDGHTLAIGNDCVFISDVAKGLLSGRLLSVKSGDVKRIALNGGVFTAAVSGDLLALVGGSGTATLVSIYRCSSGLLEHRTTIPGDPHRVFPSFSGAETILIIDPTTFRVTPISLRANASAGTAFHFSGPEVDFSLERARRTGGPANSRIALIEAHLSGANGNHLLFVGPYKYSEGLRLAEFDHQGRQVASYRLRLESDLANRALSISRHLAYARENQVILVSQDGILQVYRK